MRRLTGWDQVLDKASRLLGDATQLQAQVKPAFGRKQAIDAHAGGTADLAEGADVAVTGAAGSDVAASMPEGIPERTDQALSPAEARHAAGLMRVNHVGEVCAQALYQGQAATAGTDELRGYLLGAADEEKRHLDWTSLRIAELGGQPSRLVPFWYASSYLIGAVAGLRGDKASLGFMAETERQVEAHLASHLKRLPAGDARSRAIVRQMQAEEIGHAEGALARGGRLPPLPVRQLMRAMASVMTTTAYRV